MVELINKLSTGCSKTRDLRLIFFYTLLIHPVYITIIIKHVQDSTHEIPKRKNH
jgi:hypothetical protein